MEKIWRMEVKKFSCNQAALRTLLSVCASVRPSVAPFSQCPCYHIIMKLPLIKVMQKVKVRGQRSRSQRSKQILTQFGCFQTVTPVWIHRWLRNDAQSSIGEVPYCSSRSSVKFQGHMGQKIASFDPNWAIPDCNFNLNSPMAMKWCTKREVG